MTDYEIYQLADSILSTAVRAKEAGDPTTRAKALELYERLVSRLSK